MAIFDSITAIAWLFSSYPLPTNRDCTSRRTDGAPDVYGASGTWAGCRAQAFFVQLGLTSMFYNVALSLYYALTIVRNSHESDFDFIRRWMIISPIALGLALAFGGLKFYNWIEIGCHLDPAPSGPLAPTLVLVVIPLTISIALISGITLSILLSIRKTKSASQKWVLSVGTSRNLQSQVFWQSLLYTCSFYISSPILFCLYVKAIGKVDNFYFTAMIALLPPFQGFANFLVYIRPRLTCCLTTNRSKTAACSIPSDSPLGGLREFPNNTNPFSDSFNTSSLANNYSKSFQRLGSFNKRGGYNSANCQSVHNE